MHIDAHAHLDRYDLVGRGAVDAVLADIEQHQISTISNSMDPPSYERTLEIAARSKWVLPIFGVHPWNASQWAGRLGDLRAPAEAPCSASWAWIFISFASPRPTPPSAGCSSSF